MKYSAICIALYDYQAQGDEEISFSADSVLYILDKEDPDWYKAQLKVPVNQDGPVGLIPANYIENVNKNYSSLYVDILTPIDRPNQ